MPSAAQVLAWLSAYWRAAESPESTIRASRRTGLAKRPAREWRAWTRWAMSSRWREASALPSMRVAGMGRIIGKAANQQIQQSSKCRRMRTMAAKEPRERVHELRELLERANRAYYVGASPIMSDAQFDKLLA